MVKVIKNNKIFIMIALSIFLFFISHDWLSLQFYFFSEGSLLSDLSRKSVVFSLLITAVIPTLFLSLLLVCIPRFRGQGKYGIKLSLLIISVTTVSLFVGHKIRKFEYRRLSARSQHIIEAIQKYKKETGVFPVSLKELVANSYLQKVPSTGLRQCSEYIFRLNYDLPIGPIGSKEDKTVPWLLAINCRNLFMLEFDDLLLYEPSQKYEQYVLGAPHIPINNWGFYYGGAYLIH